MPLNAVDFVPKGPVKSADMNQFYNLFTGVMTDQPVTLANTLSLGGNQGTTTVPLRIYGAVGQTTHLMDLYADHTQSQPGWGIGATGNMAWGPSGSATLDTYLSRIAGQNGHTSDTAGILIQPYLEVAGSISTTGYQFPNGTVLDSPSPQQLRINQDLLVERNLNINNTNLLLHSPGTAVGTLSIESSQQYVMISSQGGSHLACNAYWDGTNWQRWSTSAPSFGWIASTNGMVYFTGAAGTGTLAWTSKMSIDINGTHTWAGGGSIGDGGSGYVHVGQLLLNNGESIFGHTTDGVAHPMMSAGSDNTVLFWNYGGSSFRWVNQGNSVQLMSLDNSGNLAGGIANITVSSQVNAATFNATNNNYYFASNPGIYWRWNGSQIQSSHAVMNGGNAYYFAANGGIYWNWTGSQIQASHAIISGGAYYFSGGTSVYWTWTGTWLQTSHGINNVGVLANNQQVCTASSYDNNVHGNGFLAPNNNPGGYALGQTWGTYSCVDHAFELGLRREPITTALEAVKAIPGYSYDHVHFEADGSALLRDKAGQLVTRPLYGFRASEVAAYLPELVENDPNGEPAYVDLDRMVVVLWEALKQHIAEEHSA